MEKNTHAVKNGTLTVRRPILRESEEAAALIYSTGREIFNYAFYAEEDRTLRFLQEVFPEPRHPFSCTYAWVGELEGRIAGIIHFVDAEEKKSAEKAMVAMLNAHLSLGLLLRRIPRFIRMTAIEPNIGPDEIYINHVATDPEFQRRGVAAALLAHCERQALDRGKRLLSLDVEVGNQGARRVYDRFGFRETHLVRSRALRRAFGFQGFHHMEKEILR